MVDCIVSYLVSGAIRPLQVAIKKGEEYFYTTLAVIHYQVDLTSFYYPFHSRLSSVKQEQRTWLIVVQIISLWRAWLSD